MSVVSRRRRRPVQGQSPRAHLLGHPPSGEKTLGNYSGGFRQYVATQEQGDGVFCIVDLHSISTAYEPDGLHEATLAGAAMLFATGLDPERSTSSRRAT